jgi:hypothetical protein
MSKKISNTLLNLHNILTGGGSGEISAGYNPLERIESGKLGTKMAKMWSRML